MGRILVVDDDAGILAVLKKLLKTTGHEIVACNNPLDALQKAGNEQFDLFVFDVTMPRLDGLELCARIKEDPRTSAVPVIFLTARNTEADALKGYFMGAHYYLSKPVESEVLLEKVKELVSAPEDG